jgi:histidinol dehydrogenase
MTVAAATAVPPATGKDEGLAATAREGHAMRILSHRQKSFAKQVDALCRRRPYPPEIDEPVRAILAEVRRQGDAALCRYAQRYDGVKLKVSQFRVKEATLEKARRSVPDDRREAIRQAIANVTAFARQRLPQPWSFSPRPGVIVGERFAPLDRIGAYIPGGTAPLVSTVIHTVAIARAAGVREIVAVTPPGPGGAILPELLYALTEAGATEIYRLGGVYAIGALAYGTKTVRKVEKIVGPGNAYVTAAKRAVYGEVALDMVAGPSEIMILADDSADPEFVAADLLSQAEHDPQSQAILVTPVAALIPAVAAALRRQAARLSRTETVRQAIAKGVWLIEVADLDEAVAVASRYGAEHLEILCRQPGALAKRVTAAGAIFLGPWTPEAVGDFVAGPSHVLPTGGTARFFSGLTVEHFFRRMSVVNYQQSALRAEQPTIAAFAAMEGLDAHGRSAAVRLMPTREKRP